MTPSEAITSLIAHGMTEAGIGQAVGARQSTINRIKRGDMIPNWETGEALVTLAEAKKNEASNLEARDAA